MTSTPVPAPPAPNFVSPPTNDSAKLDATHDNEPIRYRTVGNLVGVGTVPPGFAMRELDEAELHLASAGEPCSFFEAERDKAWRAAMREEIDAVERNKTWELVNLPHGHCPIGLKWVFKLKKNEAGAVIKHKA